MIKQQTKKYFHTVSRCPELTAVYAGILLFSACFFASFFSAPDFDRFDRTGSDRDGYTESLTRSKDCEAPAFRSRLGTQLRQNVRSSRSNYQFKLHEEENLSGRLPAKLHMIQGAVSEDFFLIEQKSSSYQVYSQYTLPVRAGPPA